MNLRTYLKQFQTPLISSLGMIGVMLGLKEVLSQWSLAPLVFLGICIGAGGIVYALVTIYFEPNLSRELGDWVKIATPKRKSKKTKSLDSLKQK